MDVALAQIQQKEVALRNLVALGRANLTTQVGWGPEREVEVAPLDLGTPEAPDFTLEEAFDRALRNRPELAELKRVREQAGLAKQASYQAFVPTVAGVKSRPKE